jgi:hypothetical protein
MFSVDVFLVTTPVALKKGELRYCDSDGQVHLVKGKTDGQ